MTVPATPTPDDGVRRSSRRAWDETVRPTVTPPEGMTYDAVSVETSRHLVLIHDHLRGELTQVLDLVERVQRDGLDAGVARDAISEMTLRQNEWTVGAYCASYCRLLTTHHTIEDLSMFPQLRAREEPLGPVLDRLAEEHVVIHGVLEELDRALVAFVRDRDTTALQDAVDLLSDALLSHLAYEESQLLEPLARHARVLGGV